MCEKTTTTATSEAARSGSRRRRLWELPANCHCPVIGVCLPVSALSKMFGKVYDVQEEDDYAVHVAANATEAQQVFATHPAIDVLLTDVVMPGASGPEMVEQLLARRPGLKVVYMSGYTEDAIVNRGVLEAGVVFLHKPFTAESLDRKLREALDLAVTP